MIPPMGFNPKITGRASKGWHVVTLCYYSHSFIRDMMAKEGNRVGKLWKEGKGTQPSMRTHHGQCWTWGWAGEAWVSQLRRTLCRLRPRGAEVVAPRQGANDQCDKGNPRPRQCVGLSISEVRRGCSMSITEWETRHLCLHIVSISFAASSWSFCSALQPCTWAC